MMRRPHSGMWTLMDKQLPTKPSTGWNPNSESWDIRSSVTLFDKE